MVWVGIDPGLSGALAVITNSGRYIFLDTPTVAVGKKSKRQMNLIATRSALVKIKNHAQQENTELHVTLERVSSMPGQGVTSMFNFGMGFGMWQGLLAALEIPYSLVAPVTWKRQMMPDMQKEKGASIQRVGQLFPEAAKQLTRKKDHGKADALLLAAYGRLVHGRLNSDVGVARCSSGKTR